MTFPLKHPVVGVPVLRQASPFADSVIQHTAPAGATVGEIIATTPDLPWSFHEWGEARIDGKLVPQEMWPYVRPRAGHYVTLHIRQKLGKSGGILSLIATVAVIVAAAAVSYGALGPAGLGLLGSAFASGGVGAILGGAAITIAGTLAIGALTTAPTLDSPAQAASSASTGDSTNAGGASLTGNVLDPGGPSPRVCGSRRLFPPLASPPLIEVQGEDEVVEGVYVLGGAHALTDAREGNIPLDDIDEIDYELADGLQGSSIQSLITRGGQTRTVAIEMSGHVINLNTQSQLKHQDTPDSDIPKWHSIVTRKAPDEYWITINWQGLFISDAPSATANQAMRIRFKQRGAGSWTNGPEIHFSHLRFGSINKMIVLKWRTFPTNPAFPPTAFAPIYAYKSVPAQTATGPASGAWTADAYFSKGAGNNLLSNSTRDTTNVANVELQDDRVILYLDPATFPQDGIYDIQLMRSSVYQAGLFTPATYTYSGFIYDLFGYALQTGFWQAPSNQQTYLGKAVIARVASVWNINPIATNDFATLSIRARNRAVGEISVNAAAYVPDWTGTRWEGLVTTSNPAPHIRDILGGTLSADPLVPAMIDDDPLSDNSLPFFRQHCIDNSYTCDAVFEGVSAQKAADTLAACAYARTRQAEKFGVIIDRDRSAEAPAQVFAACNMSGFKFDRSFPRLVDGYRVRFDDSSDDFRENQIVVLDPLRDPNLTTLKLEDVRYEGIITEDAARARAIFDLTQARKRMTYYSGTAGDEGIICKRGDLVGVNDDVMGQQFGSARVTEVITAGGNVIALRLSGTVPVRSEDAFSSTAAAFSSYASAFASPRTGVAIRCLDGTILTKEIAGASTSTNKIRFIAPFTDPGRSVLDEDCLLSVGALGSEMKRMLVFSIDYTKERFSQLTFVPEAPELFA